MEPTQLEPRGPREVARFHWQDGLFFTRLEDGTVLITRETPAPLSTTSTGNECGICGQPMPPGEESFVYHGYSGPCPPKPAANVTVEVVARVPADEWVSVVDQVAAPTGAPETLRYRMVRMLHKGL